ncbi:cupin domain-containing protein [Archaeoglobales archaeon]|nr:MAG: carbohydrate-binding protein [Archaeoglobales archaeon ex4484_92]RLI83732.1 MAG: cupin domain-containing protein [Archaeoglobales archaeon]HDN74129.1 cupin domain-containing protein [Archaeoglobus sp.]
MKLEPKVWENRESYRTAKLYQLSEESFVQLVEVEPNKKVGKHFHIKQTEIFVILEGYAKIGIGNRVYDVKPGEVYLCKPKDVHWVENSDNVLRILVFKYNWAENDTYWE